MAAEHSRAGEIATARREVRFEYSPLFPQILQHCRATLLVSTYQAGKVVVIGTRSGQLAISFLSFDQAMGVAAGPRGIAIGARGKVWFLEAAPELAPRIEPAGRHDGCFLARQALVTGNIQIHEMAWSGDRLWVINTLFSALSSLSPQFSFVPHWQPPFVSSLAAEDRCHLNGLALRDGRPAFVTAMAETDTPAGWRPTKASSGVVLDVASGQVVTRGLAMPHSPRWFDDRLWVLDSGRGRFDQVDLSGGHREQVVQLPGYTRGLALHGQFAFVGLSRIRETAVFGGLPVQEQFEELKCGVAIVDLISGQNVAAFQFHSGVEEIFDVQVLPGMTDPVLTGPETEQDESQVIWLVPPPEQVPALERRGLTEAFAPPSRAGAGQPAVDPGAMVVSDLSELNRQGLRLHETGRLQEAVDTFRRALAMQPRWADAWNNLGNIYQDLRQPAEAISCYRRAIQFQPRSVYAWRNLGYVLKEQGEIAEGIAILEQAQQIEPNDVIRFVLATSLPPVYESMEDLRARRRRLENNVAAMRADGLILDVTNSAAPTNFYAAYHGLNDRDLQQQLAALLRSPQPLDGQPRRPRGKRIRLGMISRHFRNHTIGRLNLGLVRHLPRDRFEVHVISVGHHDDQFAREFQAAADHYVALPTSLPAIRQQVAAMGLDLLYFADVGMDTLTYSLCMSRLAPVQCATWGHPVTTGSPVMDWFLSARELETAGEPHYTERLALPGRLGVYYYRPEPPPRKPREAWGLDPGRNLYLCFQNLFKIHPEFDAILAGILRRDPRADIVMMEGLYPAWTRMLQERFARTIGEDARRIRFLPGQSHPDFLALYLAADVSLDPIHFGGGNTTYEALALGLPVVTWPSEFLRCRLSYAMYRQMGYEECIVHSADQYIDRAVAIGSDRGERARVSRAILDHCGVLFEDQSAVDGVAAVLEEMAG